MREPREDGFFDSPTEYRLVKPLAAQPTGSAPWSARTMLVWGIGALLCAAAIGVTLALLAH
jgi:hypothetical protein